MINFALIIQYLPNFLHGALVTVEIGALGCMIGIIIGTILGIAHTSKNKILRTFVTLYITVFRGTPMLIQIFMAVFVLPQIGIRLPDFWAATVAIGLNSAAYLSQIIRSGIQSVGTGQIEAAKVLGMNRVQTMRLIILPQALRVILPSINNELITLVKDSSLASTVGVMELTKEARHVQSVTFDAITVYCCVAFFYLLLTSMLSFFLHLLEKKLRCHAQN
ncbi:MAG TPA: amino acid ABC transporter permease [Candidatus Babeliales bacterium]|nr:amino acid ABC transporter permease [Candidatus Babeliales bacterium]